MILLSILIFPEDINSITSSPLSSDNASFLWRHECLQNSTSSSKWSEIFPLIAPYFLFRLPCNNLILFFFILFPFVASLLSHPSYCSYSSVATRKDHSPINSLSGFLMMPALRHFAIFPFVKVFFSLRTSSLSSSIVVQLLLTNLIIYFFVKCCPVGGSPVHLSSFSGSSYVEIWSPIAPSQCLWLSTLFPWYLLFAWFCLLKYLELLSYDVNATIQTAGARRYKGRKSAL